jgi:hypothetical protein
MWKVVVAVILIFILMCLVSLDKPLCARVNDVKDRAYKLVAPASTAPVSPPPTSENATEETKKEGFCPKLMQKYGFCDAGAQ